MPVAIDLSHLEIGPDQGMNPPSGETEGPTTPVKSAKVPRPANAFILYRKDHHESVKLAHPGIHNNQICKLMFSSLHKVHIITSD